MPSFWEQIFSILIIAVSMVFGGYLYRKRHDAPAPTKKKPSGSAPSGKRPKKRR